MKVNGAELRRRRQATGIPVLEFAPLVKLSPQHLWNLEGGHARGGISPEAAARVARQLACRPEDFLLAEPAA